MHSLEELPFDVIQLVASFLLPYDVLALSTSCQALKPLMTQRNVWIQIAESISRSRPLPFTAAQAVDLPIQELVASCLRAHRIAIRWAEPHIYPRAVPYKIVFPDKRIITYFTFLPGSRHVMVQDAHNVLSCWTVDGLLLATWRVQYGAKLTRWKPCDDSENTYDFRDRRVQAVEIMIELPMRSRPTRCDIILLLYAGDCAKFEAVSRFIIPSVFELFSAMSQDELRGALVKIQSQPERVGIYLTDKNTEQAICIDTGLSLVPECIPQALLSSSHVVLYWETLSSAHTYTYEMDALRSVLVREGRPRDDPMLRWPVRLPPSDVRAIPFRTVNASTDKPNPAPCGMCQGCGTMVEQSSLPSTDLSENRDVFTIIIPKWHTLREDLKRNRTRSVLCFSQRPSSVVQAPAQALAMYVNAPDHNLQLLDESWNPIPSGAASTSNNSTGSLPTMNGQASTAHHSVPYVRRLPPKTTITHHYFDYVGSSLGSAPRETVRTILADAPLRKPRSMHLYREHMHPVNEQVEIEEFGDYGGYGQDLLNEGDLVDNGIALEGMGVAHFNDGEEEDEEAEFLQMGEDEHQHDEWDEHDDDDDIGSPPPDDEDIEYGGVAALQQDLQGLALELGDPRLPPMQVDHDGSILNMTPEAAQALMAILQDPFGGNPIMGYGGRCAMWVEEHPRKYRANGRAPVLRVATFPTYEPPEEDKHNSAPVHPELEISRGRVGTLHLPEHIALESSYTFDLDDVRGFVGVATLFGELWLVDFS